MNDLLNRLRAVNESDNTFSKKIAVDVYIDDHEVQSVSDTTIKYDIEVEYRSWGINGIIFAPIGGVELEVEYNEVRDDAETKHMTLNVDLSGADINWVPGKAFYPSQLTVYADKNGKVNKVEIGVDYWTI